MTAPVRVACPTCAAPYAPRLTDGRCPVCDTAAPGGAPLPRTLLPDPDDRLLAIVGVATIANVLLLGLLAVLVVSL